MVKNIVRDGFGELLETGKAAAQQAGQLPKQIVQSASQQISGKKPAPKMPKVGEANKAAVTPDIKPDEGIKDLLGEAPPPEKMDQLKQKDVLERQKGLDEVRSKLGVEKIKRYQDLQQKIAQEQKKKEEIPEYEAGKTGYRTLEEKAKWMEEQKKKEEEAKKREQGPLMPESAEKMPDLRRATHIKAKKGTKELGKQTIG